MLRPEPSWAGFKNAAAGRRNLNRSGARRTRRHPRRARSPRPFDSSSLRFPRQHYKRPIHPRRYWRGSATPASPSVSISGSKFPPSRESTQPAIETRSEFRYRIDAATLPTRSRRPRPAENGESCRVVRRSGGCLCGRPGGRRRGRSPHGACGRCCAHGRRR